MVYHRNHVLIRCAQPNLCYGFLSGCVLTNVAMLTLLGANSPMMCTLRVWTMSLPPVLAMACLFAKSYRVYKLFTNTSMRKIVITDFDLHVLRHAVPLLRRGHVLAAT